MANGEQPPIAEHRSLLFASYLWGRVLDLYRERLDVSKLGNTKYDIKHLLLLCLKEPHELAVECHAAVLCKPFFL